MGKKKKKKSLISRIIKTLLILLFLIPLCIFGYVYYHISSMTEESNTTIPNKNFSDILSSVTVSDDITNILLIGTDERSSKEKGRADSIMIATLDEKHGKLKLTSVARDTYVEIRGRGKEKVNHSYAYGGAELLIDTLENSMNIKISNYVRINFKSFTELIDALGGLKLDVKQSELKELNKYIPECYNASIQSKPMKLIENSGVQTLNGYQSLSYARIRKNDSAIERDRRQRAIMQALMDELSSINVLEIPKVLSVVTKYIKTDMNTSKMIKYAQKVLKIGNFNIYQTEFPSASYSTGKTLDKKGWVLDFNSKKCIDELHKFIFEDIEDNSNSSSSSHSYDGKKDKSSESDDFFNKYNEHLGVDGNFSF